MTKVKKEDSKNGLGNEQEDGYGEVLEERVKLIFQAERRKTNSKQNMEEYFEERPESEVNLSEQDHGDFKNGAQG